MTAVGLLVDIAVVCAAALVGGVVAKRLGQPVVLGYLLAGVVVGPNTPGYVADVETVSTLAEWGVVFLLFAVGVEFSFRSLLEMRKVGLLGGCLQVGVCIALGLLVGRALGFGSSESLLLGVILAMSSTMVVLKLLEERGEHDTVHGRTMLALLITQDLLVVVFAAMVPILGSRAVPQLPALLGRMLVALLVLGAAVLLSIKVFPWVLRSVAATKSRELFLLAVVAITFSAAIGTEALGFSLALGAFVAGMVVSETEFSHLILAEVKPFRDFFAAVFFVSIGMLAQPQVLLRDPGAVTLLVLAVVVGKFLVVALLLRALGVGARVAVTAGLGLAQIGEFSFVLARLGLDSGAASARLYAITVVTAVITLLITPLLARLSSRLAPLAEAIGGRRQAPEGPPSFPAKAGHVILCGYGRVGRRIRQALVAAGLDFVVVDDDQNGLRAAREAGDAAILGDASYPDLLQAAGAAHAAVGVVTIPDAMAAALAVEHLRRMNPGLAIIARAHQEQDVARLREAGADAVVWPEFEAGIEMVRRFATQLGLDAEYLARAAREAKGADHDG
jgi:monovalent cation:H+ antiporter-2, CPA2 family